MPKTHMLFLKFETLSNVAFSNFAILACRQVLYSNSSFKPQLPCYSRKASTSHNAYLDALCNKAVHSCRLYGSIILLCNCLFSTFPQHYQRLLKENHIAIFRIITPVTWIDLGYYLYSVNCVVVLKEFWLNIDEI